MRSISECEELLRNAMLTGDVAALDALLADELLFVTHFGRIVTKADDLEAHRQKLFTLSRLHYRRQEIRDYGDTAVSVTVVELEGVWGAPFSDTLVYTRVWRRNVAGTWQIVAGQATEVAE